MRGGFVIFWVGRNSFRKSGSVKKGEGKDLFSFLGGGEESCFVFAKSKKRKWK